MLGALVPNDSTFKWPIVVRPDLWLKFKKNTLYEIYVNWLSVCLLLNIHYIYITFLLLNSISFLHYIFFHYIFFIFIFWIHNWPQEEWAAFACVTNHSIIILTICGDQISSDPSPKTGLGNLPSTFYIFSADRQIPPGFKPLCCVAVRIHTVFLIV